jgi:hypothetical protein
LSLVPVETVVLSVPPDTETLPPVPPVASLAPIASVPAVTLVVPVKVLVASSSTVPAPDLTNVPVPAREPEKEMVAEEADKTVATNDDTLIEDRDVLLEEAFEMVESASNTIGLEYEKVDALK